MSKPSSNPRKKRILGPPIDLDELYNAPNLRGMLSFLERPPEEARRRYEEKLEVDRADAEQAGSALPRPAEGDPRSSIVIPAVAVFDGTALGAQEKSDVIVSISGEGTEEIRQSSKSRPPATSSSPEQGFRIAASILGPILRSKSIVDDPVTSTDRSAGDDAKSAQCGPPTGGDTRPGVPAGSSVGMKPGPTVGAGSVLLNARSQIAEPSEGVIPTVGINQPHCDIWVEELPKQLWLQHSSVGTTPPDAMGTEPPVATVTTEVRVPTVGRDLSVGIAPPVPVNPLPGDAGSSAENSGRAASAHAYSDQTIPTVGQLPSVGTHPTVGPISVAIESLPARNSDSFHRSTGVNRLTCVNGKSVKIKAIRDVQDALTLAGQILYKVMYGVPDGGRSKTCSKGYRQLAAEAHVDKDTVRDLIADFKEKGIVRETGSYDADTRSSKTYEILSYKAILQLWRDIGISHVTSGRRPLFCNSSGDLLSFRPTVGTEPSSAGSLSTPRANAKPNEIAQTVAPGSGVAGHAPNHDPVLRIPVSAVVVRSLNEAFGHVDDDAVRRIISESRKRVPDATDEEIASFVRSTAQRLRRMRNLANPVGMLITQVPKCFEGESFKQYREAERQRREAAEAEERRFREELRAILDDPNSNETDKTWARLSLQSSD